MAAFIIDGDKGGVGKSFVARVVADYLIDTTPGGKLVVVDCDPSNADVVGGNGFYEHEVVGETEVIGMLSPVQDQEGWFNTVDKATQLSSSDTNFVFSLPAAAGLYIDDAVLSMFELVAPVQTVWVMGKDASSVDQLNERINRAPAFYERGLIALNEHHGPLSRGTFDLWLGDPLRQGIVGPDGWSEITVPGLNPFVTKLIGNMPFHRAVALSGGGKLSPTIKVGIDVFRRTFRHQMTAGEGMLK